jgi:hypothetical protein
LIALVAVLAFAPAALADTTIGSTAQPAGSSSGSVPPSGFFLAPVSDDPSVSYHVPASGGRITSWSVNTTGATAGTPVELLVLRPSGGSFVVLGTDARNLPTPLPASGVATFSLASPVSVTAGDTIGHYTPSGNTVAPLFSGGSTPAGGTITGGPAGSPPSPGQTLSPSGGVSPGGFRLNLAVVLAPSNQDISLTQSVTPSTLELGGIAQFVGLVRNPGPGSVDGTVSDTLPAGLAVRSAFGPKGPCAVSGQSVSCPTGSIPANSSAPVVITVKPTAKGSYSNSMAVASSGVDPNPANNSATSKLTVNPARVGAGPFKCLVPPLGGVPLSTAKKILKLVKCRTGKVSTKKSRSVRKGTVIKTSPGAGRVLPLNAKVALVVSRGR